MFFRKKRIEDDGYEAFKRSRKPFFQQSFSQGLHAQWIAFRDVAFGFLGLVRSIRLNMPARLVPYALFFGGIALGGIGVYVVLKQRRNAADTVVVVRGVPIKAQDFYHRMETQVGSATLNRMIAEELVLQYACEKHISLSDRQIETRMKYIAEQPGFVDALKAHQGTQDDVRQVARLALAKEAIFGSDVSASEAEVQAYYRLQSDPKNPHARYYVPETAHIAVIVTQDEAQIRKAYQELLQGKSFDVIAKTYSIDKSASSGGNAPPVLRGRSSLTVMPDMDKAVFALKPGQIMPPHRVESHFYLILCQGQDSAQVIPFAAVKDQCEHDVKVIKSARTNEQVAADFSNFRKKANIQVFWEQYYYDLMGKTTIP